MKAIQYIDAGKIAVNEIEAPKVKDGWGLIKVACAGICGTDLNIYAGTHPRARAPLTMGHEFSGEMAADAPGLPKGTRVTVYPLISCGECIPCKTGNSHVCDTLGLYGIDTAGGMAEYVTVPLDKIVKLPDGVSDRLGAFIEPMAVAVHTIRETGFTPGDNALIFGCGTIGLCMALMLKKFGATQIIMAETDPVRRAYAKSMGIEVVDPTCTEQLSAAALKVGGNGFDCVFDCAGVQPVADVLLDLVRVRGKIIIVASYKKPAELPLFKGMAKEVSIRFVRVYRMKDFEIAAKIAAGDAEFEKIITHVVKADDAQRGFDLLFTKGTGAIKVMFTFE